MLHSADKGAFQVQQDSRLLHLSSWMRVNVSLYLGDEGNVQRPKGASSPSLWHSQCDSLPFQTAERTDKSFEICIHNHCKIQVWSDFLSAIVMLHEGIYSVPFMNPPPPPSNPTPNPKLSSYRDKIGAIPKSYLYRKRQHLTDPLRLQIGKLGD